MINYLQEEMKQEYLKELLAKLDTLYKTEKVYPPQEQLFACFDQMKASDLKVVILGQDPYHGEGEANGLAFAVSEGIKLPPSLQNIYKELYSDLGIEPSVKGTLESWTKEGILLLNSCLTVEKDKPASHKNLGWQEFTDAIIKKINEKEDAVVFILWGNFARSKKTLITNPKHYIIESTHPSPFSARNGFFGSKPFSKTNAFLKNNGAKEIDWHVY